MFYCLIRQKITESEIESSTQVCNLLITAIERQQVKLVKELQEKQDEAERRAEELLDELEREINDLQTRSSELQHLELAHNPLHLLQVRHLNSISAILFCVNSSRTQLMTY